jgi:hypothetical protein
MKSLRSITARLAKLEQRYKSDGCAVCQDWPYGVVFLGDGDPIPPSPWPCPACDRHPLRGQVAYVSMRGVPRDDLDCTTSV